MLILQPDQCINVSPADNGALVVLGVGSQHNAGASVLHFVNNGDLGKTAFVGSITILGCSSSLNALAFGGLNNPNPLLQYLPYRKIVINGTTADYSFDTVGTPLTGSSIVQIPNAGLWVAALVACTAGSGSLYTINIVGAATP